MTGRAVIGLISDTHGLVRPEAIRALEGSDHILHAGDVGSRAVLDELARLAPVTAVRGNIDREAWAETLPMTTTPEIAGIKIHIIHDIADLARHPLPPSCRIVLCGHSHKPAIVEQAGVLHVNPGSAGRKRFSLPITLGRLTIEAETIEIELFEIVPKVCRTAYSLTSRIDL